jgi:hypothetical protein
MTSRSALQMYLPPRRTIDQHLLSGLNLPVAAKTL